MIWSSNDSCNENTIQKYRMEAKHTLSIIEYMVDSSIGCSCLKTNFIKISEEQNPIIKFLN